MKIDLEIMDLFKELEEVIENAPLKGLARKSISLDKEEVLAIISTFIKITDVLFKEFHLFLLTLFSLII